MSGYDLIIFLILASNNNFIVGSDENRFIFLIRISNGIQRDEATAKPQIYVSISLQTKVLLY